MNTDTNNAKPLLLLQQAFDALEAKAADIKTLARYEPDTVYIGTGEYVAECVRADDGDYYLAADVDVVIEALRAEVERLRRKAHPAITHCDNCGCDWLDNGLNPIGCPYCELRREVERRWEGNRRAAQEYVEDMRDVLREAAQVCKDLDDEALAKEGRLACGAECAAAIADLAVRWNVPFFEEQA